MGKYRVSEKKVAKEIGAKLIKNSGRGIFKSDMRINGTEYVIDLKEAEKSFKLDLNVWAKVCTDAASYGYESKPLLLVKFKKGIKLAVIDWDDLDVH